MQSSVRTAYEELRYARVRTYLRVLMERRAENLLPPDEQTERHDRPRRATVLGAQAACRTTTGAGPQEHPGHPCCEAAPDGLAQPAGTRVRASRARYRRSSPHGRHHRHPTPVPRLGAPHPRQHAAAAIGSRCGHSISAPTPAGSEGPYRARSVRSRPIASRAWVQLRSHVPADIQAAGQLPRRPQRTAHGSRLDIAALDLDCTADRGDQSLQPTRSLYTRPPKPGPAHRRRRQEHPPRPRAPPGLRRPPIPLHQHKTPVKRLHLASAAAHPGSGVQGAAGANAAWAALRLHGLSAVLHRAQRA
ncbi:hypothetical protein [Streptomyces virginiae]